MMKKMWLVLLASLTLFTLAACGAKTQMQANTEQSYQESVADLTEISLDQLNEKIANSEDFLVYLGRPTCEYCQAFVPKLAQAYTDKAVTIYYVDSDKAAGQKWDDFIDHFGIKTVPNFSYFSGKELVDNLQKGSESTPQEISDFIETYGK